MLHLLLAWLVFAQSACSLSKPRHSRRSPDSATQSDQKEHAQDTCPLAASLCFSRWKTRAFRAAKSEPFLKS